MNKIESLENSLYTAQLRIADLEAEAHKFEPLYKDMANHLGKARDRIAELEAANTRMWDDYVLKRERVSELEAERDRLRGVLEYALGALTDGRIGTVDMDRPAFYQTMQHAASAVRAALAGEENPMSNTPEPDRSHRWALDDRLAIAHGHIKQLRKKIAALEAERDHAEGQRLKLADEIHEQEVTLERDLAAAHARIAALEAALEGIANMPHYDQDDPHRLRHMAANAIKQPHTSPLTATPMVPNPRGPWPFDR